MSYSAKVCALAILACVPNFLFGAGFVNAGFYHTKAFGNHITVADLNGDGHLDIVEAEIGGIQTNPGFVSVLLGNGDGTFSEPVNYTIKSAEQTAIADFNSDGKLDIAVAALKSPGLVILFGNGDGTFQAPVIIGGTGFTVVTADFNLDGKPDLAYATKDGYSILLGQGDGSFKRASMIPLRSDGKLSLGDFDGNGVPDLVLTLAASAQVDVLLGDGTGKFQLTATIGLRTSAYAAAAGDFDLNGDSDLVAVASTNVGTGTAYVLLSNGNGSFTASAKYTTGIASYSASVADFNGDGLPDIVVGSNFDDAVNVLTNIGGGLFAAPVNYPAGNKPSYEGIGDFNEDGAPDMAVANFNGVTVLLNAP